MPIFSELFDFAFDEESVAGTAAFPDEGLEFSAREDDHVTVSHQQLPKVLFVEIKAALEFVEAAFADVVKPRHDRESGSLAASATAEHHSEKGQ